MFFSDLFLLLSIKFSRYIYVVAVISISFFSVLLNNNSSWIYGHTTFYLSIH